MQGDPLAAQAPAHNTTQSNNTPPHHAMPIIWNFFIIIIIASLCSFVCKYANFLIVGQMTAFLSTATFFLPHKNVVFHSQKATNQLRDENMKFDCRFGANRFELIEFFQVT